MAVSTRDLLDAATRALVADPAASTTDIARAAGISRSTLHARFPSRRELLVALALEALDLVEAAYADARPDDGEPVDALRRIVERMVPLGPRVEWLLRERSLDGEPEVDRRYAALDDPLIAVLGRARSNGDLRPDLPSAWLASALVSVVCGAWDQIADGRMAPRDAPDLVLAVVLDGARPR